MKWICLHRDCRFHFIYKSKAVPYKIMQYKVQYLPHKIEILKYLKMSSFSSTVLEKKSLNTFNDFFSNTWL